MIPPYRIGCTRTPPGRNLHRVCYNDVDRGGAVLHLHHHHTGASAPAPLLLNHRPNYYTVVIRYSPPRGESVPASSPFLPPSRTRPCPPPPSIITETSPRRYIQGVHCHSNPPPTLKHRIHASSPRSSPAFFLLLLASRRSCDHWGEIGNCGINYGSHPSSSSPRNRGERGNTRD